MQEKCRIPIILKLLSHSNGLELLNEHHLLGLLPNHLAVSSFASESIVQYKKQWIHNQIILEVLESLSLKAQSHGIEAAILKGSHLLLDLYTDLGSRFLSDIDLLISPSELVKWEIVFSELGFTSLSQKTFHGNHFKREWCKIIGQVEINIEIHTKLFFHLNKENWQFTPTPFANISKLRSEDLFIHLAGHLAFQHTFANLNWLFDLYFYFQRYNETMDWKYLFKKSQDLKLFRSVQMCLWALREHFDMAIDQNIIILFSLDKTRWWQRLLTDEFFIFPERNKSKYFLIKHATKDQLTSALRYDLAWFYHYKVQALWLKE